MSQRKEGSQPALNTLCQVFCSGALLGAGVTGAYPGPRLQQGFWELSLSFGAEGVQPLVSAHLSTRLFAPCIP